MKIFGDKLYLTFDEIVALKMITARSLSHTKQIGKNWVKIKDPADRRKALIAYEPLHQKYKNAIIAKYGNPYEYAKNQLTEISLENIVEMVSRSINNDACKELRGFLKQEGIKLGENELINFYWADAWFRFINSITSKRGAEFYGFKNKGNLCKACIMYWQSLDNKILNAITNFSYLKRKLSAHKKGGITTLVSKKYNNKNRLKSSKI